MNVCLQCASEIPADAGSPFQCPACAAAEAARDAEVAEAARVLELAAPLHEVLVDVLAGVPGYETSSEVLFSALVEVARRYMVESGCDADLTAQALLENLEVSV